MTKCCKLQADLRMTKRCKVIAADRLPTLTESTTDLDRASTRP